MLRPSYWSALVLALVLALTLGGASAARAAPSLDLKLDRGETLEFWIPPGQVAPDAPGLRLFPVPAGAGGGLQASVPVPAEAAMAQALRERLQGLQTRGQIADLQTTPCRKFLPESGATPAPKPPDAPAAPPDAEIIQGTAASASGGKLGPAAVLVHSPPPNLPGTGTRPTWQAGVDDRGPALGIPDVNGHFYVQVSGTGPHYALLAPVCNCATTVATDAGNTTSVPIGRPAVAISTGGEDVGTASDGALDDICYCGPDMGAALTAALGRLQQRLRDLPDGEKGAFDGPLFMNRNADAFDAVPAPRYKPGVKLDEVTDREAAMLCPSGHCIKIEGGQSTFWLAGHCLPRHMSNEILAAFVAAGVGVPFAVFQQGANMRELLNYHALEGTAPIAAYQAGYGLQDAIEDSGSLSQAQVEEIVNEVLERSLFGYFHAYTSIKSEYPTLAHCQKCPDQTPGAYGGKDFTRDAWTLDDGSQVGGDLDGAGQ